MSRFSCGESILRWCRRFLLGRRYVRRSGCVGEIYRLGFYDPFVLMSQSRGGFVYILASKPNGTLYVGVTNDIVRRVYQHRTGEGSEFVEQYGVTRLVHLERFDQIEEAIRREKQLKPWKRAWKLDLIRENNPAWEDLYEAACRTYGRERGATEGLSAP